MATNFLNAKRITSTATTIWTKSSSFVTDESLPNESQTYLYSTLASSSCSFCDDKSLVWNVYLHGLLKRLIAIYSSSPFLLVVLPLILGIFLGLILGVAISWNRKNVWETLISQCLKFTVTESKEILCKKEWDNKVRQDMKNDDAIPFSRRESRIPLSDIPNHIAVIMDGNRRYGKEKYGIATKGHWDGSRKLFEFCRWCLAEQIKIVTVYAFSTENWSRPSDEVSSLMTIFSKHCDELRLEAIQTGIKIRILTTDDEKLPSNVKHSIKRMVDETSHLDKLVLNVCLSYGSRSEVVNACRTLTKQVLDKKTDDETIIQKIITEQSLSNSLLSYPYQDPDLLIRTSGEMRFSNFLLWQCAYTEIFFLNKHWPSLEKEDLLNVIREYARGRQRRFGK